MCTCCDCVLLIKMACAVNWIIVRERRTESISISCPDLAGSILTFTGLKKTVQTVCRIAFMLYFCVTVDFCVNSSKNSALQTILLSYYGLQREKPYLLAFAHNEDSNQPTHTSSLTSFLIRMKKCIFGYPKFAQMEILVRLRGMRRLIWIFAGRTCPKVRFLTFRLL